MNEETGLRAQPPNSLSNARAIAHKAIQLVTKAARANLPAKPDDSHSNLGWDGEAKQFLSHPLAGADDLHRVALSLSPLSLCLVRGTELSAKLPLNDFSEVDALQWLDTRLAAAGLNKASNVTLPYELPPEITVIDTYRPTTEAARLDALSAWFDFAYLLLSRFATDKTDKTIMPSPVRCWPHHFDIATYISLETGDPETAKGIGVGMSPGDESYDQPYFYINPWPTH